jgi:hypothetical protein
MWFFNKAENTKSGQYIEDYGLYDKRKIIWKMLVLEGADKGNSFDLNFSHTKIGRSKHCDIQLNDNKISRVHLIISFDADLP